MIIGHGRGWNPDFELYGALRTKIAEAGLHHALDPVAGARTRRQGRRLHSHLPRWCRALRARGQIPAGQGLTRTSRIVSHSLGATMANQYLIKADEMPVKAWVFIGIINGLEEMFRIKIPVLDVFGSKDWEITQVGAYERKKQIDKVAGLAAGRGSRRPAFLRGQGGRTGQGRGRASSTRCSIQASLGKPKNRRFVRYLTPPSRTFGGDPFGDP